MNVVAFGPVRVVRLKYEGGEEVEGGMRNEE
jgi:hypothetical protein